MLAKLTFELALYNNIFTLRFNHLRLNTLTASSFIAAFKINWLPILEVVWKVAQRARKVHSS
jgi:hypothetical protein